MSLKDTAFGTSPTQPQHLPFPAGASPRPSSDSINLTSQEKQRASLHTTRSYSPPRNEPSPSYPKRHTSPRLIVCGIIVALVVFLTGLHYTTPDLTRPVAAAASRKMTSLVAGAPVDAHTLDKRGTEMLGTSALTEDELLEQAVEAIFAEAENPPTTRTGASFPDLTLLETLPKSYIPVPASASKKNVDAEIHHKKRLIVVGDIHGMLPELEDLLAKLNFDTKHDHLVCAGDMISKGPDSVGVVSLLMKIGASAVRGNHEDRVLLAYRGMRRKALKLVPEAQQRPIHGSDEEQEAMSDRDIDEELGDMDTFSRSKEYKDRRLAKKFSKKQVEWLASRPVILKVGAVDGLGTVVVVHGGIVPGVKLEKQDPYAVMNMRTIDLKTRVPSEGHKGTGWTKLFNKWQTSLGSKSGDDSRKMTVIYGHDSRRGLAINDFTKGLDSGCLKGGMLTAFVMEGGAQHVETSLVSVRCRDKKP